MNTLCTIRGMVLWLNIFILYIVLAYMRIGLVSVWGGGFLVGFLVVYYQYGGGSVLF